MKFVGPLLLLVIGCAIYSNSFRVPILFDDEPSIQKNETIRTLWPPWKPLSTPQDHDFTTSGRPIANLSFAINYALSGENVWSYHAFNLAIHILAALTLFGLVGRTLQLDFAPDRVRKSAEYLAFTIAIIWLVHPLQTSAVTYLVQRVESLAGLFYLLTLYCFVRGSTSRHALPWFVGSIVFCTFGMGTKELMVSAPIAALLYDRHFLSRSFSNALRTRWFVYVCLFATWIILAVLVITGPRLATVSRIEVLPIDYLKTQCWAIIHYLRLCIWPSPLVFDYGVAEHGVIVLRTLRDCAPWLALTGTLGIATLFGIVRRHWLGFLGACFFMILAPSSSIVPVVAEPVAEHRMYIPLAVVLITIIFVVTELFRRFMTQSIGVVPGGVIVTILVVVLGYWTFDRNWDYQSPVSIWTDTIEKWPENARGHFNLGLMLSNVERHEEAVAHYQESVRLHPENPLAHNNLANALVRQFRFDEAIEHYRESLRIQPDYHDARHNLDLAIRLRDQQR